jgi:hypothetical protein
VDSFHFDLPSSFSQTRSSLLLCVSQLEPSHYIISSRVRSCNKQHRVSVLNKEKGRKSRSPAASNSINPEWTIPLKTLSSHRHIIDLASHAKLVLSTCRPITAMCGRRPMPSSCSRLAASACSRACNADYPKRNVKVSNQDPCLFGMNARRACVGGRTESHGAQVESQAAFSPTARWRASVVEAVSTRRRTVMA